MLSLSNAASIDDLRLIAKRRMPKFAFDFIDGGAEDEISLQKNRSAFQEIELLPKYLAGASHPKLETEIFGKYYSVPFGVAPMGFLNMAWPGADMAMARLAAQNKLPYVVSSASSTSLEKIAQVADGNVWFQVYVSREDSVLNGLLKRAKNSEYEILVVTVDVPQPGKRDRDIRNKLHIPFRPTLKIITELMLNPMWSLGTMLAGPPKFGNFELDSSEEVAARPLAEIQKIFISPDFLWDDFRWLRDLWEGPVLLKGILHPEDAAKAIEEGCDGIIVSNHGGRQVDYGPASIAVLPSIAASVGDRVPLILDGGVRRGADIIRAKALGASLVLVGRAFAYGAAAGTRGVYKSFNILESELRQALGQLGIHSYDLVN